MHQNNIKTAREAIAIVSVMAFLILLASIGMLESIRKDNPFIWIAYFENMLIVMLMLEILYVLLWIIKMKGFRNTWEHHLILTRLEHSLLSADIIVTVIGSVAILPKIYLNMDDHIIILDLSNVQVRKRMESIQDILSTALPDKYTVRNVYISSNHNQLQIEFTALTDSNYVFESPKQYLDEIKTLKQTELLLDKNTRIDLKDYPHVLITGGTGSGKSYYSMQILMQALARHWQVSVLDYKRSYHMFKDVCNVSFSIDEIVSSLHASLDELHNRQQAMADALALDPTALAIDCGFPVHLVLFEEYLAVVNSGADKKILNEIEKMLLELVSVGRSLNVNVVMVMQVSSATSLNTSIRSNLPVRIVFGNAPRTILETTFGISDVPDIQTKMPKGAGLIKLELDAVPFHAPELLFPFKSMLEALGVIFDTSDANHES